MHMKIVIFQPMLKYYRIALYENLHKLLAANGHELRVIFGMPPEEHLNRQDNIVIDREYYCFEQSFWIFGCVHILDNLANHFKWADIIITDQGNRHFHTYFLLLFSYFRIKPFAFWGHGQNRQGNPKSLRERIKKRLATKADWWFAYTNSVADYLQSIGFDSQRISVLNNSIDTLAFKQSMDSLTPRDISEFRQNLKIPDDARIGLFCGSLHKDKEIEFLLESALRIKQKYPKFILFLGGSGTYKSLVEKYADQHNFIIYFGRLDGKNKSLAFKCSNVFLNPGMVGLAILDAFSASLPLFTTKQACHSPEIEYLQHEFNGLIGDFNIENYADLVISAFQSETILNSLKANAQASSNQFSIENMAINFSEGIENFILSLSGK